MRKENKSRYAILGMLCQGPMSGYAIKKTLEQSVAYFWHESYGQIYPMLKQLAAEGLTTSHTEKQAGKPERYIYTLTEEGQAELSHWLVEPVDQAVERNELLLKLFFGSAAPVATNSEHIRRFRELQAQLLERYTQITQFLREQCAGEPNSPYHLITLNYGIHRTRALIAWCDETLDLLQRTAPGSNASTLQGDAVQSS